VEEKKRKEEYERKLKIKKELQDKINQEQQLKQDIDNNINKYQEQSIKIMQRINTMHSTEGNRSFSLGRNSYSVSCSNSSKKIMK
jgi:hypothetical protein